MPPWSYVAFYYWLRHDFAAHALIHLGKHGNLEWLPGRPVGCGADDWPELLTGHLPHAYPFIVNNPGEGTQAKRRTHALIIDHLTPPLNRAGLYGDLAELEQLLEEYQRAGEVFPERCAMIQQRIDALVAAASWRDEVPTDDLVALGNHLCLLKEHQIRSGLHVLGQVPQDEQLIDFLLSVLRMGAPGRQGLLAALCEQTDDPILTQLSVAERDALDERARRWLRDCINGAPVPHAALAQLTKQTVLPQLQASGQEIGNVLRFLDGAAVPAGPAGSPTRGRLDVLPTGRNFFSLDPRVVSTPTSFTVGQNLAEALMLRFFQDHGRALDRLALVLWGTSNMRTGGDDIAQALWLWGCKPVWEGASGRVTDYEIVPLRELGRPRVDVTCRISGLFRDAFPNLMRLLAAVPRRLAELDEPADLNPVRARMLRTEGELISQGMEPTRARQQAEARVFSSPPGSYGTGLLPTIDTGNWSSRADLAEVFITWGDTAYAADGSHLRDRDLTRRAFTGVEAVAQNQDNWEHDLLDADDYFQFQGGLAATIETLSDGAPAVYLGDSSRPQAVVQRSLQEAVDMVVRARVLNPRWLESMRKHGYKGAAEMAATVDYCFGYAATTGSIRSQQWESLARSLALDPQQAAFFADHNPAARRDMVQRLLEAVDRELWQQVEPTLLEELRDALVEAEGALE